MGSSLHRLIRRFDPQNQQGFTLLEIAIVLAIVALLMGMGLQTYSTSLDNAKRKTTSDRLDKIEEAITTFAIQNNYLPCPADGSLPSTNANYGLSQGGGVYTSPTAPTSCVNTIAAGRHALPWRTLGLDELYSRDGWGNRFSYATSGYAQSSATQGSIHYHESSSTTDGIRRSGTNYPYGDLLVYTLAGAAGGFNSGQLTNSSASPGTQAGCNASTNICAAYVLISHGTHAAGAYSGSNTPTLNAVPATAGETENNDGDAFFVQNEPTQQASASGLFDDIVRWKSAQNIVSSCGSSACGNN